MQGISNAERMHAISTLSEVFGYNSSMIFTYIGDITTMTPGLIVAEYEVKSGDLKAKFSVRINIDRYQNKDMIASLPEYSMMFNEYPKSLINDSSLRIKIIQDDIKEAAAKTNRDH
ncbi:hypothetical protein [Pedobacter antarcticus]|uniref:hypothetical protein n=1 Tax=Pedobacter antarcticus TaxID=34086 RepID=UPI000892404B|nr:hypothetical protein [Pedobacter antarcticus]SDL86136.1 hypothetical protein SAMN04488084_102705 [Pedobacter antarcticus]